MPARRLHDSYLDSLWRPLMVSGSFRPCSLVRSMPPVFRSFGLDPCACSRSTTCEEISRCTSRAACAAI